MARGSLALCHKRVKRDRVHLARKPIRAAAAFASIA